MALEETVEGVIVKKPRSHIQRLYPPDVLKKLFTHALLIDIDSNNEKVDIIKKIVDDRFSELGPGTNRYGILGPDGFCHKIALDRRGMVDNMTEFKRAKAIEWCAPRVYECNALILVAENVELISREDFMANKEYILNICAELAKTYIFEDIGYAGKNFCNWGIRKNGDLVILDTGYMIPILGNENVMECPVCGSALKNNAHYTGYVCSNGRCGTHFTFIDLYRQIGSKIDDELYESVSGFTLPNFDGFNDRLYNSGIMKGGHIHYDEKAHEESRLYQACLPEDDIVRTEDILSMLELKGLFPEE